MKSIEDQAWVATCADLRDDIAELYAARTTFKTLEAAFHQKRAVLYTRHLRRLREQQVYLDALQGGE